MSQPIRSFEPATGHLLWEGRPSDLAAQVQAVARCWPAWAAMPSSYRVETMRRFANGVRAEEDAFADLIARETGRPLWHARDEVTELIQRVDKAIHACSERTGQRRLEGALGARMALRHKPHGVMAVIAPHVFPARIPADHIVPALLAGNGVVFKPSEKAPATGEMLVRLLHEAGVIEDLVQCVIGGEAAGAALAAHEAVNGVLFTGSTHTGLAIARRCAANPARLVALAMSGNNPLVAWDTPDIPGAAALIVQSAFGATGQHCLSARRLIVRDTLRGPLVEEVKALADRLIIDHPHAAATPFMGPVIDMQAADGLTESFLYLMSNGGRPIKHMQRPFEDLPFVTPAMIDVTNMKERPDIELFAPLLQIVSVSRFEEAIAEANNSRYGLCATLVGGSPDLYDRFWSASRAGIVNWNRPSWTSAPNAPIGGIGLSGNHHPGGHYSADHCAYPVASAEMDQPRAAIGIGLRQIEIVADR
ncbi:N-succinylglutamate 5-semialdehyde dehydrogenase [Sphingobium sp. SYK-6]|uniref:succinylglutamate-semialdehyde dehydrogenase n=1 Tax=Sphingobium sp. (strain NBRC 103272 / SYK-6) TaxID=627192 RepID=UPI00022776C4|nr:succinylglutamate-semialdehyde dehydrogenase [Sphingobium sp. SYK-6]BAK67899.1 N-succinylglutamate 5-semialdehyde dehydrogenase [Sphingobium sp. SYK-6]